VKFILKKLELIIRFRFYLFKDLYLSRFLKICFFFAHGIIENFSIWHLILIFVLFLSFFFVDFISPTNNPVFESLNDFKRVDKNWKYIEKSQLRDSKIDKILKNERFK
jgi:hypothetical protein